MSFIDPSVLAAAPDPKRRGPARPTLATEKAVATVPPITVEELLDENNPLPSRLRDFISAGTSAVQTMFTGDEHKDFVERMKAARALPHTDPEWIAVADRIDEAVNQWRNTQTRILSAEETRWVRARIIDNLLAAGALAPLTRDPNVTEILVRAPAPTRTADGRLGQGTVVEIYGRGLLDAPGVVFTDDDEVLEFVGVLLGRDTQPPTTAHPIVSATLADGARLEAQHPALAGGHAFVSIRRHPPVAHTLVDLVNWGAMSKDLACYLASLVRARLSLVVAGGTSSGKALDVDTPIPTPNGFVRMGDLTVGDVVFDENGEPCRVVGAYATMLDRPCYEVVFSDGSTLVADHEHLWLTETRQARRATSRGRGPRQRQFKGDDATLSATRQACFDGEGLVTVRQLSDSIRRHGGTVGQTFVRKALAKTSPAGQVAVGSRNRPADGYDRREAYATLVNVMCEYRNDQRDVSATAQVVTTADIRATLRTPGGHVNHSVPLAGPAQLPEVTLPLDPYLLGVWLGDGATQAGRITTADPEVVNAFTAEGFEVAKVQGTKYDYGVRGLQALLRQIGVFGDKHIPDRYLFASAPQRLALLQGLMDSDGTATGHGTVEFTNTNSRLARQVRILAASLGLRPSLRVKEAYLNGKRCKDAWTVTFAPEQDVFRLRRKAESFAAAREGMGRRGEFHRNRYIVDVREVPSRPVRCIMVDSPSHLYLAGETFIPTHNTTALNALAGYLPCTTVSTNRDGSAGDIHLIIIEDTREVKDPTHLRLVSRRLTRPSETDGVDHVDIRRQVKSALRARPDVIIVGEVRGPEAIDALTAMNTGHEGSMLTCHANSAAETVIRLETMMSESGEVSERAATHKIASSVDIIVFARRLPDGRRRITEVVEVQKPDLADTSRVDKVVLRPLWQWDKDKGECVQVGELSEAVLDVRQMETLPLLTWDEVERVAELSKPTLDGGGH